MDVAGSRSRLAEVLTNTSQFEEAESLLLAALPIFEAESGDESEEKQETLALLIALYGAWGQPEHAESYQARLQATDTWDVNHSR